MFVSGFENFDFGRDYLRSKPLKSPFIALRFLDCALRGIGQVVFANNPLSGFLILVGLGFSHLDLALGAFLGVTSATITAIVLDQPQELIEDGIFQFSPCLIGTVLMANSDLALRFPILRWAFVIVGSILCVPIQMSLTNLLGSLQIQTPNLPESTEILPTTRPTSESTKSLPGPIKKARSLVPMTLPFNLMAYLLLSFALNFEPQIESEISEELGEGPTLDSPWLRISLGTLGGLGQVYAAQTLIGSGLMAFAIGLDSPKSLAFAVLGSFMGTLMASFVDGVLDFQVQLGIWSYNHVLNAQALGLVFYEWNWRTQPLILVLAGVFTSLVNLLWANSFQFVFTMPFVLSTWMFLLLQSQNGLLKRN